MIGVEREKKLIQVLYAGVVRADLGMAENAARKKKKPQLDWGPFTVELSLPFLLILATTSRLTIKGRKQVESKGGKSGNKSKHENKNIFI